jgi:hypothetical protein
MASQLALDTRWTRTPRSTATRIARTAAAPPTQPLCAACQAREARYGFRTESDDPHVDRPRALCFECFRVEIGRRQDAARAVQARLPIEETLADLTRRRRRAQIAARHALAVSGL